MKYICVSLLNGARIEVHNLSHCLCEGVIDHGYIQMNSVLFRCINVLFPFISSLKEILQLSNSHT